MSGHSRWSQIKHKKSLTDQKRGQLFSKLSKNITLAARRPAPDIDGALSRRDQSLKDKWNFVSTKGNIGTGTNNIALANAIEQARSMNMPNDNIERAVKKASEKDGAQLEEIVVEAIGPEGVALRIKGVTDNKNRTISEIKKVLSDHEAKMVQPGSIGWMFRPAADVDLRSDSRDNPSVPLSQENKEKLDELLEALDDLDDVSDVVSNLK